MAIGDPKTDTKEAKRKRAIKYKKTGPKKYSPGFFAMFTTTPTQAAARRSSAATVLSKILEPSPKSAKGRAKAKKLKDDIRDAGIKRNIQEVISRSEKAQKKKDDFKGLDAPKGDKKFNVGVSKGGVPFKEAFAHFRKKGAKTFTWNGKKYTTELAKPKGKK